MKQLTYEHRQHLKKFVDAYDKFASTGNEEALKELMSQAIKQLNEYASLPARTNRQYVTLEYDNGTELQLECEYDYSPEEPMVMYYKDGSGYPGSAEEFYVTEVRLNGIDITQLIDELDANEKLDELAKEKFDQQCEQNREDYEVDRFLSRRDFTGEDFRRD